MDATEAYSAEELGKLQQHYSALKDKASYDAFVRSAHELLQRIGADPYHVRMAITRGKSMMEFGSRAAYRHSEGVGGIRVGLLMMESDVPQVPQALNPNVHYFDPRGGTSFVKFTVPTWSDIPHELFVLNEKAMRWEYERIKGTKLVEIRKDSGTTNEALIYAVVHGVAIADLPQAKRTDEQQTKQQAMGTPLNRIFHGPPGTGKTFHTVGAAVAVCDPAYYDRHKDDPEKLRERFNELLVREWDSTTWQIGFCTFHQSFSYEDFVEGIKPVPPAEKDTFLRYETRPGLLKRMAERAAYHAEGGASGFRSKVSFGDTEYDRAEFYKLSLGDSNNPMDKAIYDHCIRNNVIAIGYMGGQDVSNMSEADIRAQAKMGEKDPYGGTALSYFSKYLKNGSYVIVSNGNSAVRAIGRVTGAYRYEPDSEIGYPHFRGVEWLVTNVDIPVSELYERKFQQQPIYQLKKEYLKRDFFVPKQSASSANAEVKNFVLIIDEINRGNVAGIFGELITLIEENKRKGRPEALEVTLPYSQEPFSIPDNLYIIGTMNTADRSVEALDAALRRRFSFVAMMPEQDKIQKLKNTRIEVAAMLKKINERMVQFLDEDHQIGHSHFWDLHKEQDPLPALRLVFADKIIPQLEEYFHRDRARLRLVLGDSFVEKVDADDKLFNGDADDIDFELRPTYRLRSREQWTEDAFMAIYA